MSFLMFTSSRNKLNDVTHADTRGQYVLYNVNMLLDVYTVGIEYKGNPPNPNNLKYGHPCIKDYKSIPE